MGFLQLLRIGAKAIVPELKKVGKVAEKLEPEIKGLKLKEPLNVDVFTHNQIKENVQLALPAHKAPLALRPPNFVQMTEAENALIPEVLHNTKMGKSFAEKIPEIRNRQNEKGLVYKENGKLAAQTKNGADISANLEPTDIKKVNFLAHNKGIDLSVLHNHPMEGTLSASDLCTFFASHNKLMMATLPSGGYASLYRTKPMKNLSAFSEIIYDFRKLVQSEALAQMKSTRTNLSNSEAFKILDDFRNEQLNKLVTKHQEYGLKYEYKHGNVTSPQNCGIVPDLKGLCKETENEFKKEFINSGYTEKDAEEYLRKMDETPIEEYLNSLKII